MRPKTAICPPVSSTARSRSSPRASAVAAERVSRHAISWGFGSGLKPRKRGKLVFSATKSGYQPAYRSMQVR